MSRADRSNSESRRTISGEAETDDSELPPDSIVIPITEDTPWQYSAYDSGESTREITNPKSHSNPFPWSKAGPNSNRVAATNLNATTPTPIMGIPAKIKLPAFAHCQNQPSIFPRWRTSRSKKSSLAYSEPGSPKVSCWGKVLSEREREELRKQREARREVDKNIEAPSCCHGFSVIMACAGDRTASKRGASASHLQSAEVRSSSEDDNQATTNAQAQGLPDEGEALVMPQATGCGVGVGVLKRLSSKRRAAAASRCGNVMATKEEFVMQGNNLN